METDMSSDFKLDLVEKLFAIDTEPKTPFTTQVTILSVFKQLNQVNHQYREKKTVLCILNIRHISPL